VAREIEETFSARRVDVVLGGVSATVEIHFDDKMADGLVLALVEIPRLRGMGVNVGYSCQGGLLKITVSECASRITVKNTGSATVSGGGVANTGVIVGDASAPSGEFTAVDASMAPHYDGTSETWLGVHRGMAPKVTLRLYTGSREPLLYRVTE